MKKKDMLLIGAGALAAIAAALVIWKKKEDPLHPKPPKGAPQLDIENPGSQDEFPSSPSPSQLG